MLNKFKVNLIKLDGINILYGKGIYDMANKLVTEKSGFILRTLQSYKIEPSHMKRNKKGKAVIGIDIKSKKSFDLDNPTKNVELKCNNCLSYLMQEKNWKAHQSSAKIPKWHDIKMMFAGFGLLFFILMIINIILGRVQLFI